jgi:hypothetical protein
VLENLSEWSLATKLMPELEDFLRVFLLADDGLQMDYSLKLLTGTMKVQMDCSLKPLQCTMKARIGLNVVDENFAVMPRFAAWMATATGAFVSFLFQVLTMSSLESILLVVLGRWTFGMVAPMGSQNVAMDTDQRDARPAYLEPYRITGNL